MITIIAVGKKHESWIERGVERYETRLRKPFDTKWVLLPHSSKSEREAREIESEAILLKLNHNDFVILLDETGTMLDSPTLSRRLSDLTVHGKNIVFVIGGAYGVNKELVGRADLVWSLSALVFPHQLVRLLLVEQLYRAQEIDRGGLYHHV